MRLLWAYASGQIMGMTGIVIVDGEPSTWMGYPFAADQKTLLQEANQTSFEYTSTKSIFTFDVGGKINLTATFLSPLTPHDLKRQSLTMSYLHVNVVSTDGASHDVSIYTDISAEWVSGDRTTTAQWDYGVTSDNIAYHRVYRQEQLAFTEINEQAEWGYWYWATQDTTNVTYQSGQDKAVRAAFEMEGKLPNTKDSKFRAINDDFPVFGFARDFGSVTKTSQEAVFVLGLAQENAIQFDGSGGNITLPSLWTSYFSSDTKALSYFYNDWMQIRLHLAVKTTSPSPPFPRVKLLELPNLQETLQIHTSSSKKSPPMGTFKLSTYSFPCTRSSFTRIRSSLSWPSNRFLKTRNRASTPNTYSMHDLGSAYPNATGHTAGNDEEMPLEECGNMLIMSLSYYRASNDSQFLKDHYPILDQWTQYLIASALVPASQLSTDDFAGPLVNQTNLALKGIIGIAAMAEIANLTSHSDVASNYSNIAKSYVDQWINLAVIDNATLPHTSLSYSNPNPDSYSLLYNLYPDTLLSLHIIPPSIYTMQSNFYPSIAQTYGVPLDSRNSWTKSDWNIWCASIAEDSTKKDMINRVAQFVAKSESSVPLTDFYDSKTGGVADFPVTFIARPVVGGHFAGLALGSLGVV
ncbi:hypothetical protein EYC84_004586 [Monilinia fructicola]|uniref:Glutaminase A n=1 Tax=Monilinia fructicola TaxID=38448 RepID=A0A5M9K3C4_MONFR|nr:hypothetical protein EYC84_004586 [Monilinia fructicola]